MGGKPNIDQSDQKLLIKNLTKQLDTLLVKSILSDKTKNKIQKQPNLTTTKDGGAFSGKQDKPLGWLFTPFNSNAGFNVSLYGV